MNVTSWLAVLIQQKASKKPWKHNSWRNDSQKTAKMMEDKRATKHGCTDSAKILKKNCLPQSGRTKTTISPELWRQTTDWNMDVNGFYDNKWMFNRHGWIYRTARRRRRRIFYRKRRIYKQSRWWLNVTNGRRGGHWLLLLLTNEEGQQRCFKPTNPNVPNREGHQRHF